LANSMDSVAEECSVAGSSDKNQSISQKIKNLS